MEQMPLTRHDAADAVSLECRIDGLYSGFFEWRTYRNTPTGVQIYSCQGAGPCYPSPGFPATKYQRTNSSGSYGLNITGVDWTDGGIYACQFLSASNVQALATVVVIGEYCQKHTYHGLVE